MRRAFFRSTLIATTVLASSAVVHADLPGYYYRHEIYDFDQRWSALANNGNYYCLPTSYLNLMTYAHFHGVPEVPSYVELFIFARLGLLGDLFGTDPDRGTGGTLAFEQMKAWFEESSNPIVHGYRYGWSSEWGTYRIRKVLAGGSIVNLAYGRYIKIPALPNTYVRGGGHVFTLVGYDFRGPYDYLIINDPAEDEDDYEEQSIFSARAIEVKNRDFRYYPFGPLRTRAQVGDEYSPENGGLRMIDSMVQFSPAVGGWASGEFSTNPDSLMPRSSNAAPERIIVKMPFQFTPEPGDVPLREHYEITPREEVVDWVFDVGALSVFYVTKLGRIFEVDLLDDRHHKLLHVIKGTTQLMVGGDSIDVYAMVPGDGSVKIVRLERDDNSMQSLILPFRARAMEYDPRTGGPALLASSLDHMVSVDQALGRAITTPLPNMPSGSGAPFFSINPTTGAVFYGRQGGFGIQVLDRDTGRAFHQMIPGVTNLRTLVPVHANQMIVQDGIRLKSFDRAFNLTESQFDSVLVPNGTFQMSRSHDVMEPGFGVGPEWHHIPPDELRP